VLRGIWALETLCSLGVHVVLSDKFEQLDTRAYPGRVFLKGYLEPSRPRKMRHSASQGPRFITVETDPHVPGRPTVVSCTVEPGRTWRKDYADLPLTDAVLIHLYRTLLWIQKENVEIPEACSWGLDDFVLVLVLEQAIWPNSSLNERRRKRLMNLWGKLSKTRPQMVYAPKDA